MRDLARLDDLILDLYCKIDGNGERYALVTARAAVDLRVDADDGASGIEQRASRVAGVDGRRPVCNEGARSRRPEGIGLFALTMPAVAVSSRPNGSPMAST